MNHFDIFKKLTKGIRFSRSPRTQQPEKQQAVGVNGADSAEVVEQDPPPAPEDPPALTPEGPDTTESGEDSEEGGLCVLSGVQLDKTAVPTRRKKKKKLTREKQLQLHQEQVNHRRKQLGLHVWGPDIPQPLSSLDELNAESGVSQLLVDNMRAQGFHTPTPIQMQSWPLLLRRRELLACAPTGSGKTAAFLLPLLHHLKAPQRKGFRALILAPTRELARQTHRECMRLSEGTGLRTFIITNVNKARNKFGPQSSHKFDVLVTTPNRLVYLLQDTDAGPALSLANVEWLVVDESDRLFEGGVRGFREQVGAVLAACTHPGLTRALFSATFATEVQDWCRLSLNNVAMVNVGHWNAASSDVQQELLFCGEEAGKLLALRDIFGKGYQPPVLVFVQTKERAKELFKELIYDNIMVDAIHADRTQLQRDRVVQAFRERRIWVLICTELMSRGIDFKGVNLVVNYDFPPSSTSYIHRVGRTGRASHQGRAVTFWTLQDKTRLRSVAQVIQSSGQEVPDWMLELKKQSKKSKKKLKTTLPVRAPVSRALTMMEHNRKRKHKKVSKKQSNKPAQQTTSEPAQPVTNSTENTNHQQSAVQHKSKKRPPTTDDNTFRENKKKKKKELNKEDKL